MTAGREQDARETLAEVLALFRVKGHPGRECLRTDWVPVETVTAWRAALLPSPPATTGAGAIDAAHLERQREWSRATFGPGHRTAGVVDHIRKELREVEADPLDVNEWVDVVILALDGAWRSGAEPQQIIDAIKAKQARNEARTWPDWRTMTEDQAIEHVRRAASPPATDGDAADECPTCGGIHRHGGDCHGEGKPARDTETETR